MSSDATYYVVGVKAHVGWRSRLCCSLACSAFPIIMIPCPAHPPAHLPPAQLVRAAFSGPEQDVKLLVRAGERGAPRPAACPSCTFPTRPCAHYTDPRVPRAQVRCFEPTTTRGRSGRCRRRSRRLRRLLRRLRRCVAAVVSPPPCARTAMSGAPPPPPVGPPPLFTYRWRCGEHSNRVLCYKFQSRNLVV